jgi:putative oxidoreductase
MEERMIIGGLAKWAPVPLRLVVGYGFFAHGIAKIEKGPENFVAIVQALGVPLAAPMAWLTIALEVVCGLLMLAGAFVPLITIPMLIILGVALVTVHLQFGFTSIKLMAVTATGPQFGPPGMETDLLYIACLAALVFAGPGPFSIDGRLRTRGFEPPTRDAGPAEEANVWSDIKD